MKHITDMSSYNNHSNKLYMCIYYKLVQLMCLDTQEFQGKAYKVTCMFLFVVNGPAVYEQTILCVGIQRTFCKIKVCLFVPIAQTSTGGPYCVSPTSSSGALYHLVATYSVYSPPGPAVGKYNVEIVMIQP